MNPASAAVRREREKESRWQWRHANTRPMTYSRRTRRAQYSHRNHGRFPPNPQNVQTVAIDCSRPPQLASERQLYPLKSA
jgi:hypothetical protein